jgi:hypothetical protein
LHFNRLRGLPRERATRLIGRACRANDAEPSECTRRLVNAWRLHRSYPRLRALVDPPTDHPRTARRAWRMFVTPPPERWRRFDGLCSAAASYRLAAAEDLLATPP